MAKLFATTWCARCCFFKRWFCLIACSASEDELRKVDG
jgi:hypothetical protein